MRSILRHTPYKQFATKKLTNVVRHTAQNLKQQQSINYVKYEQLFFKLYTTHLSRQKNVALNVKKIDSMCMMSQFPCKSIVEHFHATAKSYSEQYTVQTLIRLSRAYKISQADNASTADYSIHRLFFTPAFENLIQEYKYGLKKENAMSWDNAFLVAECLIDIGYADYEVFSILMNMIETRLNKQQRNQNEIRPFQIEKKYYYLSEHRHTPTNLSNDPEFHSVLKMLSQRVHQHEVRTYQRQSLKQLKSSLSQTEESQNIYHSILESVNLIETYNNDLTKLIEGIFTVRKQYRKMTTLSESKQILRNPELNLELLELEEMLLVKKLITISDIKSPQRIQNEQNQLKRVEDILISMIEPQNGHNSISNAQIGDLLNANFSEGQNKQQIRLNKLKEIAQYGRAMATLSRYAQLSRRLYNSPDARSLISMKWQKTLLLWHKGPSQTPQWKQNLHVQKIFRRTFADLYSMMKRSYSIFMFTLIEAPLRYKVQFFQSLTRLGFYEELIHLFQVEDSSKQKVQNYSNSEFSALIKILNQVGAKVNAEHLKKAALKHLKKLQEVSEFQQNKSLFSMEFTTNAVNFICQNFNVLSVDMINAVQKKQDAQLLYESLINRLAQQAKYFDQSNNYLSNDHLYQALRVLSMEKPGQFKLNDLFFKRYFLNVEDNKQIKQFLYRKNPFHSIVQQLCQKYANSPLKDHYPFIQTGFNAKGDLTAVLLCSSDQTSMDGKYVSGSIGAYIQRVKRQFNIFISPLSVNSFMEIDYDKLFDGKQFSFKQKQKIAQNLSSLFKRDELHLFDFSQTISNITSVLEKHYKRSYLYALVKFLNTLNECVRLYDRQKQILSFQLFKFRRYRLFVQLDNLKEDYNMIDKSVKEQLQKLWKKQTSGMTQQAFKRNTTVLSMIDSIQHSILNSVDSKNKDQAAFTKTLFEGKRFSIETFIQNSGTNNVGVQFINPTTYVDKIFCPYGDWAQKIGEIYPLETLKLKQASNITKILTKKYLPNANQELTILPFAKKSTLRNRGQFNFNSLPTVKNPAQLNTQTQKENPMQVSQTQIQQIKELLSFLHELKLSKSQEQLIDYIFSFDFISQLGLKHQKSPSPSVQPLPREHKSYFNYLEARNNKLYIESPNLDYLLNKLQQREQITDILNGRTQKRTDVKIQYQLGNISRKQYLTKVDAIDNQIIDKLRTLDQNILDNVDEYKLFENGLKMVRIEQDQKEIQRVLNRARYYERTLDKDFIHVRGNVDRCLKIKRQKAQKILSLYRVLYEISKPENELTQNDQQVLKKEASLITYRLQNKKNHLDSFSQKFTSLTIGDLSKADKGRLALNGSDLSIFGQLPLTDLILQFVNLLDPKIYQNFEKAIVKKHYKSSHNIPEQIFSSSLNKQFSKLANQQERAIVNEHSKLDFYEMGLLNQMVQTFKTQSKSGKQRFAQFYQGFYEQIGQLNDAQGRVELISEYLNQKQMEYSQGYNPKLVSEIKERQAMKLWDILFKKPYAQSDSQLIRKTVNKICQRIRLMGDNCPPFFGLLVLKILQHPLTDVLSKQNLISNIELFKTPLQVDSEDIRSIGIACSNQEQTSISTSGKVLEHMGLISNKNFMENLNRKINMIV